MSGTKAKIKKRLEYLRGEINAERISYGEITELQSLSAHIDPGDTLLLEWAGVPEGSAAPRLTDEQKTVVYGLLDSFSDLALVSGFYRGRPVAFVCTHRQDGDGSHALAPLFIVVTEDMKADCGDSANAPCVADAASH